MRSNWWKCLCYDALRNTDLPFCLWFKVGYRQYNVAICHRLKRKSICTCAVDQIVRTGIFLIGADGNTGKVGVYYLSSKAMQFCSGRRQQAKLAKFFRNIFIYPYRFFNFCVHISTSRCISLHLNGFTNAQELIQCRSMSRPQVLSVGGIPLAHQKANLRANPSWLFLFDCDCFVGASSSKAVCKFSVSCASPCSTLRCPSAEHKYWQMLQSCIYGKRS